MPTHVADIDVASLCSVLDIGWTERDVDELEGELRPYIEVIRQHLSTGEKIPSHIENTGSLCVPITDVTDPWELYGTAKGEVGAERFDLKEFPGYWLTTHYSTVPVVILLLKQRQGPLAKLDELCELCGRELGVGVGTSNRYFQWNLPGFAWTLHTDDDYEGVETRVHVPLTTTPQNLFAWASSLDARREDWLLALHLERGKVYLTRTDVPHTALNEHPTDGRLHLILDVEPRAAR